MTARARSTAQKRQRSFGSRSQTMINKVKDMHVSTDARIAIVGFVNEKMFWFDEADVLSKLGIAHEPLEGLTPQNASLWTRGGCPNHQSQTAILSNRQEMPFRSLRSSNPTLRPIPDSQQGNNMADAAFYHDSDLQGPSDRFVTSTPPPETASRVETIQTSGQRSEVLASESRNDVISGVRIQPPEQTSPNPCQGQGLD